MRTQKGVTRAGLRWVRGLLLQTGQVLAGLARRIQRVIEARHTDDEDAPAREQPLLALLAAASLRARIATGTHRGEPWRRLGDRVEPRDIT